MPLANDGEYIIDEGDFGEDIGWHLLRVEDDEDR